MGAHDFTSADVQKMSVEVLEVNYPTREIAKQSITEKINNFYRTNYPRSIKRDGRWCSKRVRRFQRFTCGMFFRTCA
jgi:hypothetical protein